MKQLMFTCGLPRSGKTTLRNYIVENTDLFIISADEIRMLVYGQRFFKQGEEIVWSIRNKILEYMLQQNKTILIDETNTSIRRRKPIIELANFFKCNATCLYLETPLDICLKRCLNDDSLKAVIERQNKYFSIPLPEEGADIIKLNHNKKLEDNEMLKCLINHLNCII